MVLSRVGGRGVLSARRWMGGYENIKHSRRPLPSAQAPSGIMVPSRFPDVSCCDRDGNHWSLVQSSSGNPLSPAAALRRHGYFVCSPSKIRFRTASSKYAIEYVVGLGQDRR